MDAYLVAGLIVAGLVWYVRRVPGNPPLAVQLGVGVLAGGIGGLAPNVPLKGEFQGVTVGGSVAPILAAVVALAFVQSLGRRIRADETIDG